MNNEKITLRSENFANWYTDVVKIAHLADYSSVRGCMVPQLTGISIRC